MILAGAAAHPGEQERPHEPRDRAVLGVVERAGEVAAGVQRGREHDREHGGGDRGEREVEARG